MNTTLDTARNEGLRLSDALKEYADRESWNQYERERDRFFPKLPPPDLASEPIEWRVTPKSRTDPMKDYLAFSKLEARIRGEFLCLLVGGKLCATGYRSPRVSDQQPVWISPDRWQLGRVSWDQSELWLSDESYEEVLVVRSSDFRVAGAIEAISSPAPTRDPGRPSRKHEILPAYVALRDAGKINFKSLSSNFTVIRDAIVRLSTMDSGTAGLGNETIRTAIGNQFFKDKQVHFAAQKTTQKTSRQK